MVSINKIYVNGFSCESSKSDYTPGSRRHSGESGFDSSSAHSCCSDNEDGGTGSGITARKTSHGAKLTKLISELKLTPLRAVSEKSTPEDGEGGTYAVKMTLKHC